MPISRGDARVAEDISDELESDSETSPALTDPRAHASATGADSHSDARLRSEAAAALTRTLAEEECARAHSFSLAIAGICVGVLVVMPFLGGHREARFGALASVAAILLGSLYVHARTRGAHSYSVGLQRAYGVLLATAVAPIEYYLGAFSPVSVVVTLGIFFIAQSADRVAGVAIPAYVILRYMVQMAAIAGGVLEDRGLVTSAGIVTADRFFFVFAVPMVLTFTVWMAHVSRNGLMHALQKSHDLILLAAERDAQLEEARQHLDRALRAMVGRAGRYTGRRAGSFELAEIIGVGAMGEVYAAQSPDGRTPVAVKLMQADTAERADLVERFHREIDICRKLRSQHVVRTLEFGAMEDGSPYLAMERLRGDDLAAILRDRGSLSLDEAVELVTQVAEALDEAHAAGVVHRDLKPQNLYAHRAGDSPIVWKILDFGVSKLLGSSATLTQAELVGTPAYMSPEQVDGLELDPRSDVFSMGVVLYRAITGQPAFGGAGVPEKLFAVVFRQPEAPSNLRVELPVEIDLVLAVALAKEPEHRFDSAGAFAKAFARAAHREVSRPIRDRAVELVRAHPWGTLSRAAGSRPAATPANEPD